MSAPLTAIGKYQIVDLLGQGGMGTLYLARDPSLDRLVAIKVLRVDVDADNMRARFDREARSVSRLRHPNIVTIFEYGDHHGQPFIVMEYIAGESLDEVIRRQAALPLIRKLELMEQLCAGMAYAHRARIIHRDLKPANLMLDDETASLRILDFGIARRVESDTSRHTGVIGTPSYMSPEQGAGRTLDHRSDIFSVGCVFYELLAYRTAFDGDTALSVFYKVANSQPEPLETLCPELDAAVVAIVSKLLEKKPADRYQDLEAVRADIVRARDRAAASASVELPAETSAHTGIGPRRPGPLPPQRSTEIDRLFESAASAMQQSDFDAAMVACQQVLRLDAGNAAALALLDRARAARDQKVVDRQVQRAREYVAAGSLTAAEQALDEALKKRGTDRAARALQRDIQQARSEQEREYHRADAADVAIGRARARLEAQAFEAAARAASEALAYAPDSPEAKAILGQALEAVERQRELERKRRAALAETPAAPVPTERLETTQVAFAARVAAPLELPARTEVQVSTDGRGGFRWAIAAAIVAVIAVGAGTLIVRRMSEPAAQPAVTAPPPAVDAPAPPPPAPASETKPQAPAPVQESAPQPPAPAATPAASPPGPRLLRAENAPERLLREARAPIDQKRYAASVRMLQSLADRFPNDPQVKTALTEARTRDAAQSQTAKDFARRGDQAMESRDYDAAIRLYQNAFDAYPESADVVVKLTSARAAKTRAETVAAQILGSRAPAKPGMPDEERAKLMSQADALISARLFDQAIAVYDQILAAEPENAAARQGKARAQNLKNPKP